VKATPASARARQKAATSARANRPPAAVKPAKALPVSKRTVSLDSTVATRVAAAAAEDGVSFSAWLSAAAEHSLLIRDGLRGVAEWEQENGPLTAEEIAAGEALLDRLLAQAGKP
jgi:hypothetical protein